MAQVELG